MATYGVAERAEVQSKQWCIQPKKLSGVAYNGCNSEGNQCNGYSKTDGTGGMRTSKD